MAYKKIKGRSEQPRVSKKNQARKIQGAIDAKLNNKKGNLKTQVKDMFTGVSGVNLPKNKNVTPAYLSGYKAALKQMNIKNPDAALARYKAEIRVSKGKVATRYGRTPTMTPEMRRDIAKRMPAKPAAGKPIANKLTLRKRKKGYK